MTAANWPAGVPAPDNSLLMIQGPLALDFSSRKWGVLPRIENGDLTARRPPTLERLNLWLTVAPRLPGRENHIFIKLHTHGCQEANMNMLLGEAMRGFHEAARQLTSQCNWFRYHYLTANELARVIRKVNARLEQLDAVVPHESRAASLMV